MSSLPPTTNSPVFNSSFFLGTNDYSTIATADKRYQKLGGTGVFSSLAVAGNLDCGSLTIAGAAVDLSSMPGVTAGTAGTVTASKLVMVDANKDISSFRNFDGSKSYWNSTHGSATEYHVDWNIVISECVWRIDSIYVDWNA